MFRPPLRPLAWSTRTAMAKGIPEDPLDPQFLIEHAERLTIGRGRPPTVDSHRATSAAYYAAYHTATRAITQFLFGDNWLEGVRWLSHRAVIDATRLVSNGALRRWPTQATRRTLRGSVPCGRFFKHQEAPGRIFSM